MQPKLIDELRVIYGGNSLKPQEKQTDEDAAALAFAQPIIDNLPSRLRAAAQKHERSCIGAPQFAQGAGPQPQVGAGQRLVMKWLTEQGVSYLLQVSSCQEGGGALPWWNLVVHGWAGRQK